MVVAVIAVCAGLLATEARPAAATVADDEAALYALHNQARQANGLAPLADDTAAAAVARTWAQHLASTRVLAHNPNLASQINAQVTNQWTRLGENVGYGPSASVLQSAFMNSGPHRANILGDYNRVGVGAARDVNGTLWVAVVFIKGPALPVGNGSPFLPFSSAPALVSQQYVDFLNRGADQAGLSYWSYMLGAGAISPSNLIDNFMTSPEFGAVVAPVNRLYFASFMRIPDYGGVQYWVGELRQGVSLVTIADTFIRSAEFQKTYGSLSDSAFVARAYRNVLSRDPDPSGLSYWVQQLASGRLTRGGVMVGFSQSDEFMHATYAEVQVVMTYIGMLRRSPDQSGYDYWVGLVLQGKPVTALIDGVFKSAEYADRF